MLPIAAPAAVLSVYCQCNAYHCHFVDASHVINDTVAMLSIHIVAMLSAHSCYVIIISVTV